MPLVDGYALIQEVRRDHAISSIPIIVLSASAFESDKQKSLEAGVDWFLSKPIDIEQLFTALGELLHIEWDVASDAAPITSLMILPELDKLQSLRQAAKIGDIVALEEQTNALMILDIRYVQFGKHVQEMLLTFQMHRLRTWLNSLHTIN